MHVLIIIAEVNKDVDDKRGFNADVCIIEVEAGRRNFEVLSRQERLYVVALDN